MFEVRRSETRALRLAKLLDESSNEILVFDPETLRLVHVNYDAQHNLQYTLDELKSMTPLDVMDYTREQFNRTIAPLRSGATQIVLQVNLRCKDGSQYPVEAKLQLSGSNGTAMLVVIASDITPQQRNRAPFAFDGEKISRLEELATEITQ